jgi:hypothetical protein
MSLPIERWARQAVDLEYAGRPDKLVADKRVLQDVTDLAMLHKQTWKQRTRRIAEQGFPMMMAEGTYGAMMAYPNPATVTTTSINGVVNLWPQATYTPIPANGVMGPQAYRVIVCAKITTSTSPANIGFDVRIGSTGAWTTGGTAIGTTGATMGASTNIALTASITNAFYYIIGDVTVRTIGNPGANSTAVGMFHFMSTQGTSGGLAGPAAVGTGANLLFGGTNASFDSTVAGAGLAVGAVHTVTTITHNVEQIHGCDWN